MKHFAPLIASAVHSLAARREGGRKREREPEWKGGGERGVEVARK